MNPEPTEEALADRLARALVLFRRGRRYLLGGAVVFAIGLALAVLFTLNVRRTYLSECTFAVRAPDKPGASESESSAKRAARVKDMVHERARLENAIHKFKLYPELVESAGILDAVEAMKPHVGIRARESGRFVVSFDMSETPGVEVRDVVRDVTQYLAESIAEDFVGGSIGELKNEHRDRHRGEGRERVPRAASRVCRARELGALGDAEKGRSRGHRRSRARRALPPEGAPRGRPRGHVQDRGPRRAGCAHEHRDA